MDASRRRQCMEIMARIRLRRRKSGHNGIAARATLCHGNPSNCRKFNNLQLNDQFWKKAFIGLREKLLKLLRVLLVITG